MSKKRRDTRTTIQEITQKKDGYDRNQEENRNAHGRRHHGHGRMMMTNNLTGVHASAADGEPVSYTAGSSEITLEIGDPGMKLDRGRN